MSVSQPDIPARQMVALIYCSDAVGLPAQSCWMQL